MVSKPFRVAWETAVAAKAAVVEKVQDGINDLVIAAVRAKLLTGAKRLAAAQVFTVGMMDQMLQDHVTLRMFLDDPEFLALFEKVLQVKLDLRPASLQEFAAHPGVRYLMGLSLDDILELLADADELADEVAFLQKNTVFAQAYFDDLRAFLTGAVAKQ